MKNLFQRLLYSLLCIVTLALIFPATKALFDAIKMFGPDIVTDLRKGVHFFIVWHSETAQSLSNSIVNMPGIFWFILIVIFFANNEAARNYITRTSGWYWFKKWDRTIVPTAFPVILLGVMLSRDDFSFEMIVCLTVVTVVCGITAFASYRSQKSNGDFLSEN